LGWLISNIQIANSALLFVRTCANIFILLGFLDGAELIVLNHAFTKKTQKIPNNEIKIAEQRKKDYFSRRRMS
jgi:hypothetical protein